MYACRGSLPIQFLGAIMPKIREMFRGSMGKFSFVLALVGMMFLYFLVFLVAWQSIFLPEPYYVELPEFKGRILPGEKVKPGTFTIKEDFESISQWGDDGLLSYEGAILPFSHQVLRLTAWRPDPKTPGVFQYAQRGTSVPKHWGMYHAIGKIER